MRAFVNGTQFRSPVEKAAAAALVAGDTVDLMAEPDNRFDENAIKVLTPNGHHIGYIQKDIAATIHAADVVSATVRDDGGSKILLDLELR